MKKGYRVICNGENYKVQRFYSFLEGIFTIYRTYHNLYWQYNDAVLMVSKRIKIEKIGKENRKLRKEKEKKPWNIVKTFFD